MTVWWAIPSARPIKEASECFNAWRRIGCKLAATRKDPVDRDRLVLDLCVSLPKYEGYYRHINLLAEEILERDPTCNIVVTGGDDCFPDPDKPASEVEEEFVEHFGGTLGVMQPTGGNPWSKGLIDGRRIQERIAWAPWLGRAWCRRAFMGKGPMPEFGWWHFFGDEACQRTAERLGLFWHRPDIKQEHYNWKVVGRGVRPEFLNEAQSRWDADKAAHAAWMAAGMPELRPAAGGWMTRRLHRERFGRRQLPPRASAVAAIAQADGSRHG